MTRKKKSSRFVSVNELAAIFNLTASRVQGLANEGMPRETQGKYPLRECLKWRIRYLQEKLASRGAEPPDFKKIHERLLRASAELKELELAKERGQLVRIDDVEKEMLDYIGMAKARISAIPARVAPDLVGETSRTMIQAKLEKVVNEALALQSEVDSSLFRGHVLV